MRIASLFLLAASVCGAQQLSGKAAGPLPELPLRYEQSFLKLPANYTQGEVSAVAVNKAGHVFVLQRATPHLAEFDDKGTFVRAIGAEGIYGTPHGLRIDPEGNFWVTDVLNHTVLKLNPQGQVVMVLGHKGDGAESEWTFNRPADVAFAVNGDVLVADGYGNSRIIRFDKDGHYKMQWGHYGKGPGEFDLPHAIVIDKNGMIYVADRENARIQVFDDSGKFVKEWDGIGYPYGLAIGPAGMHLFMADGGYQRVLEFTLDGNLMGAIGRPGHGPGEMAWAHEMAIGPDGSVYVADVLNWRLDVFRYVGKASGKMNEYQPTTRQFIDKKASEGYISHGK